MLEWSTCAAISLNHPRERENSENGQNSENREHGPPRTYSSLYYIHAHGIHICIHTLSIYTYSYWLPIYIYYSLFSCSLCSLCYLMFFISWGWSTTPGWCVVIVLCCAPFLRDEWMTVCVVHLVCGVVHCRDSPEGLCKVYSPSPIYSPDPIYSPSPIYSPYPR